MPTTLLNYLRIIGYSLLIILSVTLFQIWQKEHPVQTISHISNTQTLTALNLNSTLTTQPSKTFNTTPITSPTSKLIYITTDVLQATIDQKGGNIINLKLLKFPEKLNSQNPTILLNNDPINPYITQSGFLSSNHSDTNTALFSSKKTKYILEDNQNSLTIHLFWKNPQNIEFTKSYTFKRNSYAIDINYQINNQSPQTWQGNLYLQLLRTNNPPSTQHGLMGMGLSTFFGAAISSPDKLFQKISFSNMEKHPLNQTVQGGWVAMLQHYFLTAWVPNPHITAQYFSQVTPNNLYSIGIYQPSITVNPNQHIQTGATLYAGPEIAEQLNQISPSLKLTIDYGVLWMISSAIFWLMQKINLLVHNWGWSIVLVTILIKLAFYHLSAKSYRSMAGLKKIQPKLAELKEKFGHDRQKLTEATLALYRKEKVNPMGGCLPVLIQIPVFIALYSVLVESIQLRQAPFILWIQDLSTYDPYYVLPVLMGLSMFLQQRLNPPSADPAQSRIMMVIPFLFIAMFAKFPAGLMLYWFVNNILSFFQQWYIIRKTHSFNAISKNA